MNILFQDNGRFLDEWMQALKHRFPEAKVRVWQEGDDAAADYAIVWNPIEALFAGRSDLKAIFSRGAGVDAILAARAHLPEHVPLVRLTDAGMGVQMADYVVYAVLRHFRQFDQYETSRAQQQWQPLPPPQRFAMSVGVMGMGVLGQRVIRSLQQFEFPVLAWSRSEKHLDGVTSFAGEAQLPEFLKRCHALVCLLPLTDETRGILNEKNLSQLPQGAYLINVARGAHLVEEDLLKLVQSGQISGASLDVFQQEPLAPTHPFWQEPRIQITPHIAAITLISESVEQIAQKMEGLERGEAVDGIVDRQRGY